MTVTAVEQRHGSVIANAELTLIETLEDVGDFLRWLGKRRPFHGIAVDTETSGLDHRVDHVRLCQIGDMTHGWAFEWERWSGILTDVVNRWDGDYIMHNAPFDYRMLKKSGVEIPRHRIHDTLIQSRINEPHRPAGLKPQAARHVDPAAAGLQAELAGTSWTFVNVPITYEPYWTYGALDPVLTYALHQHHYDTVMSTAPEAYDIEMSVLWIVSSMGERGICVDRAYASEKFDQFMTYCDDVEVWCKSRYNVKPGSTKDIVGILLDDGVSFTKQTKSGAVSLDGDVLEHIDHPLAQAVLQRRKAQKMASTYLKFYVQNSDADSLIHPSFNSLGAKTGRMSCSNPNFQNVPRLGTSKFGDVVRNCVVSRYGFEDGQLIFADFDQIEMRILAHVANEPSMIRAFVEDGDFFVNLARQLYNDPTITKKDKRRQVTKNAAYATIYGSGVAKFALTAGIPESQGREFMNRWNTYYPNVKKFSVETIENGRKNRAEHGVTFDVSPITGRRYIADDNKPYVLTNYKIQGGAAEINKLKLIQADAAGLGEYMMATIHDEVILDVPREKADDVIATLRDVMNDDTLLKVPVTAGLAVADRWGEKRDIE